LPSEVAKKLAIYTLIGSAKMVLTSSEGISNLRHRVSSPGGTTIAGCKVLEDNGFRSAVISAVEAAAKRSAEIGRENDLSD
jgi:pyrroline-5-carboxylate reductase